MLIAFASHRYQPEEKQIMRKYFPSVVGIIDGFKKGAEDMGLKLQTSNSEGHDNATSQEVRRPLPQGNRVCGICIAANGEFDIHDEILAKCHKAGIKALSKHDSIVCRQCDKHKVTKVVCKVMNSLFGRYTYTLDIDGDLFDLIVDFFKFYISLDVRSSLFRRKERLTSGRSPNPMWLLDRREMQSHRMIISSVSERYDKICCDIWY